MYNHRPPGYPHITIPPGASPPVHPSPQGYPPYEFELDAPSGDFLNSYDNRTLTVRHSNGRPGELRSRSRSAYEPVQSTISFPEPDLHRFASQRSTLHPSSSQHRPSKSDDGHDFILKDNDHVATPFTPVTPSSASSIHYLPEYDVRVRYRPDDDVF